MIVGIGTDIIEVSRVEKATQKDAFLKRVFTQKERELFEIKKWLPQTMAANFAGKEAVAKALGTGFGAVAWTDVEILRNESGAPVVTLYGAAKELSNQFGETKVHISLSHLKELAVAYVVIEISG